MHHRVDWGIPDFDISVEMPLDLFIRIEKKYNLFLGSFEEKAYFCIIEAAFGNLKASFHCAHLHLPTLNV